MLLGQKIPPVRCAARYAAAPAGPRGAGPQVVRVAAPHPELCLVPGIPLVGGGFQPANPLRVLKQSSGPIFMLRFTLALLYAIVFTLSLMGSRALFF